MIGKNRISSLVLLLLTVVLLAGCNSRNQTKKAVDQVSTTSTSSSESSQSSDVQRIGTDEVGYVDVPANWIRFSDMGGGETYQYSAPDAYTIITLFSYDKETLGVQTIDDSAAESAANSYAYGITSSGLYGPITGSKTKIADYEAFQIYANTKTDNKMICAWIFVTEKKDKVYLVSLEGQQSSQEFLNAMRYIEETWSSNK